MLRKSQNGLPAANCLGHHHPRWESAWASFPKSSDASGNPGMRIKGKGALALSIYIGLHVSVQLTSFAPSVIYEAVNPMLLSFFD